MRFFPSKNSPKKNLAVKSIAFACSAALAALAVSGCSDDSGTSAPAGDPNAKITLTKPVTGDAFKVGDSLRVRWTVKDLPDDGVEDVDVMLSPDSGKTWIPLPWGPNQLTGSIKIGTPYWNNFAWKVADSLYVPTKDIKMKVSGKNCLVRVEQYSTNDPLKRSTTADPGIKVTP